VNREIRICGPFNRSAARPTLYDIICVTVVPSVILKHLTRITPGLGSPDSSQTSSSNRLAKPACYGEHVSTQLNHTTTAMLQLELFISGDLSTLSEGAPIEGNPHRVVLRGRVPVPGDPKRHKKFKFLRVSYVTYISTHFLLCQDVTPANLVYSSRTKKSCGPRTTVFTMAILKPNTQQSNYCGP